MWGWSSSNPTLLQNNYESVTLMNRCTKISLSHTQTRENPGLCGGALLQPVSSFSIWIFYMGSSETSSWEATGLLVPILWLCTNLSLYKAICIDNWEKKCTLLLRWEINVIFIVFNTGLFCKTYFPQENHTVSSATGFWRIKDVFFLGMWWLFCVPWYQEKLHKFLAWHIIQSCHF